MTITSLIQKVNIIKSFKLLKKKIIFDNVYFVGKNQSQNYKEIIFYFPNPTFMHLGDNIFFEPSIKLLTNIKNLKVSVFPVKSMINYFQNSNIKIIDSLEYKYDTLVITRPEFCLDLKNHNVDILYINTAYYDGPLPICNDIANKISDFLNLNLAINELLPSKFIPKSNIEFFHTKKYYLFSNYVDSSFYRITKKKNQKLINQALQMKNDGYSIIHIGTQKDKEIDKQVYDFIDNDLRGNTSINDLFYICSLDNIVGGICYDSFIMHLLMIFEKEVKVLFRGRFFEKNKKFIMEKTIPPYKNFIGNLILL